MPVGVFRIFTAALVVCVFFLSTPGVSAQEGQGSVEIAPETQTADAIAAAERAIPLGEGGAVETANPASVWNIFRVLLTLAVVAAAIYGMVFFIKRAARGKTANDPFLKILASTQLGVNRSAYILSAGTQAWLVGAAEGGVNLIAEIGDKDILNAMLLAESEKSAQVLPGRFPDFRTLLGRLGVKAETDTPGPDNIRKRSERLKGL